MWTFRERLTDLGLVKELFGLFLKVLEKLNLVVNGGKIIDASFVEVPKQRNNRTENAQIKSGEIPAGFMENPRRMSQKETDVRWTKKNNVSYSGYKNQAKDDAKSKIIIGYTVTGTSVHDSNERDNCALLRTRKIRMA